MTIKSDAKELVKEFTSALAADFGPDADGREWYDVCGDIEELDIDYDKPRVSREGFSLPIYRRSDEKVVGRVNVLVSAELKQGV